MSTPKGARPLAPAADHRIELDGELLAERDQQIAVMNEQRQVVIERYGDGLEWHPDHYEAAIRSEMRRGCEAFLRAGRYLVVARECAAHGEWTGMMDRLGIEGSQARRMMEAAKRVAALPNRATSHDLVTATKSSGKLIELLSLPEDQFAELATEGETEGLALEDVERMTVRELRAAIRDARADLDASRKLVGDGTAKAERLTKELRAARHLRDKATPDETLAELRDRTAIAALQVRADISAQGEDADSLAERFAELREQAINADPGGVGDGQDDYMAGVIGELMGELRRVRDALNLPIVNDHGANDWQGA